MKIEKVPFQKTVFVCVNTRPDGSRVACGNPGRGGVELCHALKESVKKAGLKGKVRVARTGCLDLCEKGPNAFLYPSEVWLSGVKPEDADEILKTLTAD